MPGIIGCAEIAPLRKQLHTERVKSPWKIFATIEPQKCKCFFVYSLVSSLGFCYPFDAYSDRILNQFVRRAIDATSENCRFFCNDPAVGFELSEQMRGRFEHGLNGSNVSKASADA